MEQLRFTPAGADREVKSFAELETGRKVKGGDFVRTFADCAKKGEHIKADVVCGVLERVNLRKGDLRSVTASFVIGVSNQLNKKGPQLTDVDREAALRNAEQYAIVAQAVLQKLYPITPTG